MVLAAAIVEQFECERPLLRRELAVFEHLRPLGRPEVVLHDVLTVLAVNDRTLVNHDLRLVPLAEGLGVLRHGGDHVVERRRLAVAVHAQFGVGVILVIQYLIFGAGNIDRLQFHLAVLLGLDLLGQVEDTRIAALGDLPLQFEFEILELVREDQVAAVGLLRFAAARAVEFDRTVVDRPLGRNVVLAVTAPAVERLAVEDHVVTLLVDRKRRQVDLRLVDYVVDGSGFRFGLRFGSRLGVLRLIGVSAASDHRQAQRGTCRE